MAREMLKLRKGDSAIMIKTDGSVEMAGVNDKALVDDKGNISPVILFAAAWAKKDQSLLNHMVDNFRNCVREGYFGVDAQNDFNKMEDEAKKLEQIKKKKEELLVAVADQGQDPKVDEQIKKMKGDESIAKVTDGKENKSIGNLTIEEGVENETK